MKNKSLVSVIMPVYNSAGFIAESIRSVQKQTHNDWELLVIDDASSDGTLEVVEELKTNDDRIKLHVLPTNQGAGFARNIGIKAATGDFISFLDADDLWKPHKLEKQLKLMQEEKIQVCYSSYELINEDGQSLDKQIRALNSLSFDKLKKANYIGNLTGIYNAGALGKVYCPLIRKRQDWGLWLLAVQKAGGAIGIQEPLAIYRERSGSISQNKIEMLQYNYRVYRKVLKYSASKSLLWMVLFLWEQLFIKRRRKVALK
ncbi:glycosyltransferase family 2 protein [Salinimicrobium terrae]|uniref:glycosyltransferase family 2 protein n=1 Tax=Salinimicrobium terrae TaxID=470866 RepID=UPI0003F8D68A|nr:glycosyltransferase family 2 protein [Salinimicrobium terrae]